MIKQALLLLGCPELPVQTGAALYFANELKEAGLEVFVAGTDAALRLLEVSDPRGCYVDAERMKNLDKCIGALAEKRLDFDLCAVFVHNDAGLSYLATIRSISKAKLFAVIFGRDAETLARQIDFECEKLVAKAVHNPMPLKKRIDTTIKELR
jgi:hypothetical protein